MDQLISRLNSIPNAYYEFVDSVVDYAESKESHLTLLMDFLNARPNASITDVLRFISKQPDFFDDEVPVEEESLVC